MSQNLITLTCYFEKFNYREAGQEYNGKYQKFDSVSALVSFPEIVLGSGVIVGPQKTWASLDTPKARGGKATDKQTINEAITAFQNGYQHALIWDGLFNVWGIEKGSPKHEVKFGFRGFRLSQERLAPLNRAVIQGKVVNHKPVVANPADPNMFRDASWLTVEDVYHNPFAEDKSKSWKVRPIPVWIPHQLRGSLDGKQVLIFGKFSTVAVVSAVPGSPVQTQPFVHVMAEELHVCP